MKARFFAINAMPVQNLCQCGKLWTQELRLQDLGLMKTHLLLAGLQQESNPVGVVVHGEVGQPGAGVGVNHDLVSALHVNDDVLSGHGVLVVVLMVLVEDGGNLLTVLADGQESLLVVVGGNVELGGWKSENVYFRFVVVKDLEHVGSAAGAGEDAGVGVEAAAVVAVGALEGQVLLAATVVGLGPRISSKNLEL